jgi:hypothetical protein
MCVTLKVLLKSKKKSFSSTKHQRPTLKNYTNNNQRKTFVLRFFYFDADEKILFRPIQALRYALAV